MLKVLLLFLNPCVIDSLSTSQLLKLLQCLTKSIFNIYNFLSIQLAAFKTQPAEKWNNFKILKSNYSPQRPRNIVCASELPFWSSYSSVLPLKVSIRVVTNTIRKNSKGICKLSENNFFVWFFTVFCGDLEGAGTLPPLHSSYIQKPPKKIYFKYSFSIHGNYRSNFLGNEAELFLALFVFLVCHNTKNWLKLERRCCPRESFFHLTI